MKTLLLILITSTISTSCKKEVVIKHSEKKEIPAAANDTIYSANSTIDALLAKALAKDSLNFDNWEPFVAFRSGHIFSETNKDALLFTSPKDKVLQVVAYTEINGKWVKNDELNLADALFIQFDLRLFDYNFDGSNDFYVQQSASNGHSISRGFLITIDPKSKQMTYHPEAREFGNMRPEQKEKIVYSEEYNPCPIVKGAPCTVTNKWKNGELVSVSKTCPECPAPIQD